MNNITYYSKPEGKTINIPVYEGNKIKIKGLFLKKDFKNLSSVKKIEITNGFIHGKHKKIKELRNSSYTPKTLYRIMKATHFLGIRKGFAQLKTKNG